jgi:hypothetical protein
MQQSAVARHRLKVLTSIIHSFILSRSCRLISFFAPGVKIFVKFLSCEQLIGHTVNMRTVQITYLHYNQGMIRGLCASLWEGQIYIHCMYYNSVYVPYMYCVYKLSIKNFVRTCFSQIHTMKMHIKF